MTSLPQTSCKPSLTRAPYAVGILVCAAALFAILAPASSTHAQEAQQQPFVDVVDVQVVNVDVMVTNRSGNPITDLTEDDFEVYQDGDRVDISNFSIVRRSYPDTQAPTELQTVDSGGTEVLDRVEQELLVVLYLDNYNIHPRNRARVMPAVRDFLEDQLPSTDPAMLVVANTSLRVAQPFTRDRNLLLTAVDAAAKETTARGLQQSEIDLSRQEIENAGKAGGANAAAVVGDAYASAEQNAQESQNQIRGAVASMENFVNSLAGLPHRKAVLYISDGLPAGNNFEGAYQRMAQVANASRVTFYTVDTASAYRGDLLSAEGSGLAAQNLLENQTFGNGQLAMEYLAESTGGVAITRTTNFSSALGRVARDLDYYYSLGYSIGESDGKYHEIDVRVKRRGTRVRHRQGYVARSARDRMAQTTIAALDFDNLDNSLGLRIELTNAAPPEPGATEQDLMIRLPLSQITLVPQDQVHNGLVQLIVAVVTDGEFQPLREIKLPIRIPEAQLSNAPEFLAYKLSVPQHAEQLKVAVGARDQYSSTDSYVNLRLEETR